MIRKIGIGVLVAAPIIFAQPGPPPGRGPGRGPSGAFGGMRFIDAEPGRPGRVVRNAPYSADLVTQTTQVLTDGNRIERSSTSHIYRDSEGRTRREQSLANLSRLAPGADLPQAVFITDPVGGVTYALNLAKHTATKSAWSQPTPKGGDPNRPRRAPDTSNLKTESLGRQAIEGLQADGTRTTMTIPAGQIGNEQPIQVVTETWIAAELQTVVLSKRTDPRQGETVFRLMNVSRSEPAKTLFELPADFKVESRQGRWAAPPRQ